HSRGYRERALRRPRKWKAAQRCAPGRSRLPGLRCGIARPAPSGDRQFWVLPIAPDHSSSDRRGTLSRVFPMTFVDSSSLPSNHERWSQRQQRYDQPIVRSALLRLELVAQQLADFSAETERVEVVAQNDRPIRRKRRVQREHLALVPVDKQRALFAERSLSGPSAVRARSSIQKPADPRSLTVPGRFDDFGDLERNLLALRQALAGIPDQSQPSPCREDSGHANEQEGADQEDRSHPARPDHINRPGQSE